MVKICLVIDDYNDSLNCETLLRKLGFDILTLTKESQFNSAVLGFMPDIILASYRSKNVDGVALSLKAKKLRTKPKVLLFYTETLEPILRNEEAQAVDALMALPYDPEELVRHIARLATFDENALVDKYMKLRLRKSSDNTIMSGARDITKEIRKGFAAPEPEASKARENRYAAFLDKVQADDTSGTIPSKIMTKHVAELREAAKSDTDMLEQIDNEKREFVKAMFRRDSE